MNEGDADTDGLAVALAVVDGLRDEETDVLTVVEGVKDGDSAGGGVGPTKMDDELKTTELFAVTDAKVADDRL